MKISIITPVYNEEKNIFNCYKTIKALKFSDIEWIIVNDGSTDNSAAIIQEIISRNDIKIKFINKKNEGALLAKKAGVLSSNRELITFLDCDDQISPDALCLSFEQFDKDIDIVCYQLIFVKDGNESKFVFSNIIWPIDGEKSFALCINKWSLHGCFMARRTLLLTAFNELSKECYIAGNNINDDELFTKICFFFSRNIQRSAGKYFYINNPYSTTNRFNENFFKIGNTSLNLHEFVKSNCIHHELEIKQHIISTANGLMVKYIKWYFKLKNKAKWREILRLLALEIDKKDMKKMLVFKVGQLKSLVKILFIKILLKYSNL